MDLVRTKLALSALTSRLAIILLSVFANAVIPDHDAQVFRWTVTPPSNSSSYADTLVNFLTEGLTRWDGQYFLHISNNGYTYENTLAFFPLYPTVIKFAAEFIYWLQVDYGIIHFSSAIKLAGVLVNLICFVATTLALFELSRKVLRDDYLAYKSALLFCLNPASIFFSATYSEALNCMLTFYGLLKLERGFGVKTALCFCLATACRSNSCVNVAFLLYKGLRLFTREVAIYQRLKQLERSDLSETIANVIGDSIIPTCLSAAVCLAPFVAFQWYAFTQYCSLTKPKNDFDQVIVDYAEDHHLRLPSAEPSTWCQDRVPLPYSYIQSRYWNVGFLNYFELKQFPNFLLAAPLFVLLFWHCLRFLEHHRFYCRRLGCTYFSIDPAQRVPSFDIYAARVLPKECFVFIIHALCLCTFSFFFVHVQVATRLVLSSSPVLYWLAALLTTPPDRRPWTLATLDLRKEEMAMKLETRANLDSCFRSIVTDEPMVTAESKWIKIYFVSYTVIGTIMFSNFLPWT